MPFKPKDITGQKFGLLTAIERQGYTENRISLWNFQCDCGKTIIARIDAVRSGGTQSCGCFGSAASAARKRKHGCAKTVTPEYSSWVSMRRRCLNPEDKDYSYYGGRGITICARWDSFNLFLFDMGHRPKLNYSLDRINNNGNYEPSNCRWATATEQASNKRNTNATN